MESRVDMLMKDAISMMERSENVFGISSNMMHRLPLEPSCQEAFEDLVMNFILDQEEKVKQLEEYICVIGSDFLQLSSKVDEKLKEEIRVKKNKFTKIKKIMRYPDTEDLEPLYGHKFSESLTEKAYFHTPKFSSPKSLCVKYISTIFPSPPLENTPLVTYLEEIEEIIGILMEVEPLKELQLEDLGLNTCNYDLPLSSREVPSFDEPEPQPQPLPNYPPLDVSLGSERGLKPPIKPHSLDSFRMKVLDNLTIHTIPSSLLTSFHFQDLYCYYHPCIDDPKKHYGFKTGFIENPRTLSLHHGYQEK
ncbi:hypothetical protein Tco_0429631 [Tanacetum coccineum]